MRVIEQRARFPLLPPELPKAQPPAPEPPVPTPSQPPLETLLEAATAADEASLALDLANHAYAREPSEPNLERVRHASARALDSEVRFATLWDAWCKRNFSAPS